MALHLWRSGEPLASKISLDDPIKIVLFGACAWPSLFFVTRRNSMNETKEPKTLTGKIRELSDEELVLVSGGKGKPIASGGGKVQPFAHMWT